MGSSLGSERSTSRRADDLGQPPEQQAQHNGRSTETECEGFETAPSYDLPGPHCFDTNAPQISGEDDQGDGQCDRQQKQCEPHAMPQVFRFRQEPVQDRRAVTLERNDEQSPGDRTDDDDPSRQPSGDGISCPKLGHRGARGRIELRRSDGGPKIAAMLSQDTDGGGMRIKGIAIIAVLALSILAAALATEAQQAGKIGRIGYLSPNLAANPHLHEAFRQGLRELGYVDGRNLVIEYRDAAGKHDRLPDLAAELVALKVDVIVAINTPAVLAAKLSTKTVPIVFAAVGDPVGSGLVTSLARPGGNVTGVSGFAPKLVGKRLELLKQAVPGVTRIAVLWQPDALGDRTEKEMLKEAEVAARALGMRVQFVEARDPADFDRVFREIARERAAALTVLPSTLFLGERNRLVNLAARNRLPAVYPPREYVDAGGLMSYGSTIAHSFRRAATYVDKILKGAKPGDLPVEQPTKFELVINLKTAKALGLKIPASVLARADHVVE